MIIPGVSEPIQSSQQSNFVKNFVPLGMIGHGSFSEVYKVRRVADGKIYALKKIKLPSLKPKQQEYALGEIKMLAALSCPFIVSFRQSFYDQKMHELCIVMEWANEGDLQTEVQRRKKQLQAQRHSKVLSVNPKYYIPESEVWRAVRDILSGLAVLHDTSILHRDIKAANIFKSDGIYKLGDLNIAKLCPGLAYAYTQTGTPYYASPEVWKQLPYDSKSDIWSFGCVIYEMCELSPPFVGADMNRLYESVVRGRYTKINPELYSKELSDLIDLCLRIDPKQRKSCRQMLELRWVLSKFNEFNIKDQQVQAEEFKELSDKRVCQQQLSIKLTKQLREIKSKTQYVGPGTKIHQGAASNIFDQNKLNQVLPRSNYPSQKKRILTNQSYCFGNQASKQYEKQSRSEIERPASCRTESTARKNELEKQKKQQKVNRQARQPIQVGHQIFTGRSLLEIGRKKVLEQHLSKHYVSAQPNGRSCTQQDHVYIKNNAVDDLIKQPAGLDNYGEKIENRGKLGQNTGQQGGDLMKKYKYKYKYKYVYNGVRPSSHNPNRKLLKQKGRQNQYASGSSQKRNVIRAHSVLDLHSKAEQEIAQVKKQQVQVPLRELGLGNSKYRINRVIPHNEHAKGQKYARNNLQNRHNMQELPKIRYMLANRSSNIRQQIGKIYCNQSSAVNNCQHYLRAVYDPKLVSTPYLARS